MASHYCFPSITYHISKKPFLIIPTIHFSRHPIPTRIKRSIRSRRIRRPSLQFHVLPSDFDIVETSEHHDGSVIFRFGDPSEIVKSQSEKDSESEVEGGNVAVKVRDGEHESDATVNGNASSISNDVSNSMHNAGVDIPVAERESDVDKDVSETLLESSERFLEAPQEGEVSLPVPVSFVERETNVVADISVFEVESSGRLLEVSEEGKLSISVDEGESEEERELSDSKEVSSEELPKISQDGELHLPVPISVLEEESNVVADTSDSEEESSENCLEVSQGGKVSISTVEVEREVETELSDSGEELGEKLQEISQDEGLPLPVLVSVLEGESNVVTDISDSEEESKENFLEVSQEGKASISTVEVEREVETELSDSGEELSEKLPKISQDKGVRLTVPVSVLEGESNVVADISDSEVESSERLPEISQYVEVPVIVSEMEFSDHVDTGLRLENDRDEEECLNKKDEDANPSPDTVTVKDDNLRMRSTDDSHKVIAEVTIYESPSTKDLTIEEAHIDAMQFSDQKTEGGLQTEVADCKNDVDSAISVVEDENDEVGALHDPQLDLNERPLKISQEVKADDVYVSEITPIKHFDMVSSLEKVVEDEDSSNDKDEDGSSMPDAVTESSLSVENSADTDQVSGDDNSDVTEVQLPSADLDDLVLQEPSIEAMVSVDAMEQKAVAKPQLVDTKDISENTLEAMHISYPLEAEMMLDQGVSHDAVEESVEADKLESSTMLNHDVGNSLVEAKRTEGEEQSSKLSEVSSVEAIQLELTETSVEWEEISTAALFLSSGAAVLAHPSKALTGGEDSYFLSCSNWLGVADGVSQWSLEGIAPGIYAHKLMKNCQNIVSDGGNAPMVSPIEVLSKSVKETNYSGCSTVLVAYFDGSAIHVANIGDTGFIIIRHGAVYKKSSPMLHELNFPIQVESGDNPSQLAEEYRIELDEGDTIIAATDGLFDNLYDQEISAIVSKSLQAEMKPEEIAEVLAKRALEAGGSASSRSPFADAAQAAGYVGYTGGKLDDVAVIVSFVKNRS